jgi:hypothetical protein
MVKITSRLANSVFTFNLNSNYTQHLLKCNLSSHIWTQLVGSLKFFPKGMLNTPSKVIAILTNMSDVLLLNQLYPLYCSVNKELPVVEAERTLSMICSKSKSGFSESYISLGQGLKKRRSTKNLRGSFKSNKRKSQGVIAEEEDGSEEESESEEPFDSFEESSSNQSSSECSSSSEEEEIDTLVLIDNTIHPLRSKVFEEKESKQKAGKHSLLSSLKLPILKQKIDTEEKSQGSISEIEDLPFPNQEDEQSNRKSINESKEGFDSKAPIARLKQKIERRNVFNDPRIKKVNFTDKLKINTETNIVSIEHIMMQVAKEAPLEWDNFDIYAGSNKYDLKEVVSQYVNNFSNNLALAVTNERGLGQLQHTFSSKFVIKNLRAGKAKKLSSNSEVHVPEFILMTSEVAKRKAKKFLNKYFDFLHQLIVSFFSDVQLTESKLISSELRHHDSSLKNSLDSPRKEDVHLASPPKKYFRASMIKFLFLGINLDEDTIDYLKENLREYLISFLYSPFANLWKKCFELGVLLDLQGTVVLTDSSVKSWLLSLVINLIMIGRQFQIIDLKRDMNASKILELFQNPLEEVILLGRTYTVIIDLTEVVEDCFGEEVEKGAFERLDSILNVLYLILTGTVQYYYNPTFLHSIISGLWQEDYVKALSYDELLEQIMKTISSNINLVVFCKEDHLRQLCSYLQRRRSNLFSKCIVRIFGTLISENHFEKTIYHRLMKHSQKGSDPGRIQENSDFFMSKLDSDMRVVQESFMKQYTNIDELTSGIKNSEIVATQERLLNMIDVCLSFKLYTESKKRGKYEYAIDRIQSIISKDVNELDLINAATTNASELASFLQDVNIPKLLNIEGIFLNLLQEGLALSAVQVNVLALNYHILSEDYSFCPLLYDPLGYASSFFKSITRASRNEHSFQYIDATECIANPSGLTSRIEAGTRVVLGVQKLCNSSKDLIISIIQMFCRYQIGKKFKFYPSKNKLPPLKWKNQTINFHNSFKFGITIKKREDLLSLLEELSSFHYLSFVKLFAFEERINSSLINSKPMIRELESSKKQQEAIAFMRQQFLADRPVSLFVNTSDFSSLFFVQDWVTTIAVTFTNPDVVKVGLNYVTVIKEFDKLNINDSSKINMIALGDGAKVGIQFKAPSVTEHPFDSTYLEKYISAGILDLSSTYQKVLFFFSHIRAGQYGGVDASFLFNKMLEVFDRLKYSLLELTKSKQRSDAEIAAIESEQKHRQSFASERLIRYLEEESPSFWYQVELGFVIESACSLHISDVPLFKFWLWINHTTYDNTAYSKFIYSNTFNKRQTLSGTLSMSKYIHTEAELEARDLSILLKTFFGISGTKPSNLIICKPDDGPEEGQEKAQERKDLLLDALTRLGIKFRNEQILVDDPFEADSVQNQEMDAMDEVAKQAETALVHFKRRKLSDFVAEDQPDTLGKLALSVSSKKPRSYSVYSNAQSGYKKSRFALASISKADSVYRDTPEKDKPDQLAEAADKHPANLHLASIASHQNLQSEVEGANDDEKNEKLSHQNPLTEGGVRMPLNAMPGFSLQKQPTRKNSSPEEATPSKVKSQVQRPSNLLFLRKLDPQQSSDDDESEDKLIEADIQKNKREKKQSISISQSSSSNHGSNDDRSGKPGSPRDKVGPLDLSKADSVISPIRNEKARGMALDSSFNKRISFKFDTFKEKSPSPGSSPFRSPTKSNRGPLQESNFISQSTRRLEKRHKRSFE